MDHSLCSCNDTGPKRGDPYWTSTENSFIIAGLSIIDSYQHGCTLLMPILEKKKPQKNAASVICASQQVTSDRSPVTKEKIGWENGRPEKVITCCERRFTKALFIWLLHDTIILIIFHFLPAVAFLFLSTTFPRLALLRSCAKMAALFVAFACGLSFNITPRFFKGFFFSCALLAGRLENMKPQLENILVDSFTA